MENGTSPDLFDIKRKSQQRKHKKDTVAAPALARLFGIYCDGYERRFHEKPLILKSDGPLLKKLVSQFGLEKTEQRLRAFLAWDDPFIVNTGFDLRVFYANWNRLAAYCVQQQPERREPSVERTEAYLRSLREISKNRATSDLVEVFDSALRSRRSS